MPSRGVGEGCRQGNHSRQEPCGHPCSMTSTLPSVSMSLCLSHHLTSHVSGVAGCLSPTSHPRLGAERVIGVIFSHSKWLRRVVPPACPRPFRDRSVLSCGHATRARSHRCGSVGDHRPGPLFTLLRYHRDLKDNSATFGTEID